MISLFPSLTRVLKFHPNTESTSVEVEVATPPNGGGLIAEAATNVNNLSYSHKANSNYHYKQFKCNIEFRVSTSIPSSNINSLTLNKHCCHLPIKLVSLCEILMRNKGALTTQCNMYLSVTNTNKINKIKSRHPCPHVSKVKVIIL